jgi:hypothetical protein
MAKKREQFSAVEQIVNRRVALEEKISARRKKHRFAGAQAGKMGSTGQPKGPATVPDPVKIRQRRHFERLGVAKAEAAKAVEDSK